MVVFVESEQHYMGQNTFVFAKQDATEVVSCFAHIKGVPLSEYEPFLS